MIIVHIDFTGTFNEEMNYQENLLPRVNVQHGHTVYFLTTCYRWNQDTEEKTVPGRYELKDGVRLIRIPFMRLGFEFLEKKLRAVNGLERILQELSPDVIMIHCAQTLACYPVMRYIKKHANVRLYVDSHTDFNNSANTFFSREILHRIVYKPIVRKLESFVDSFLCCTYECMVFMQEMYGISERKLELFSLGGLVPGDQEYMRRRNKIRTLYNITPGEVLIVHSGKMDEMKKTVELVRAFNSLQTNDSARLLLLGAMDEYVKENIETIINDNDRIQYLGWKTGEEVTDYLCACDLYCQPGSQSATMQNAACCRSALLLYPHASYTYLMGNDAAFWAEDEDEIRQTLSHAINCQDLLKEKTKQAFEVATEKLDYNRLAARLYY